MNVLILGAGVQGRVVGDALARRGARVTPADINPPAGGLVLDARDAVAVEEAARGMDVAVTTLPASIGTIALPALLAAGVPTVDVSFTLELPFHLDADARRLGVPVLVDFGVAPGLSHVLAAALVRELGEVESLRILVGGMPLEPPAGFGHAVYFHALDLLGEYVRPARVRRAGRDEAPDPLSETTRWSDEELGELDAFPSDGLRSLLASFPGIPEMEELTLRMPGHLDAMAGLRAKGLLDPANLAQTARALERHFPGADHPDHLLMEVQARRGDEARAFRVHVQREGALTAMSRATAFTAAAGAVVLAEGAFSEPGVHAPENLGPQATARLLEELARDGIHVARASKLRPLLSPPRATT
ncbi:MAG: saccharopine dehydrogenase C-terminal domain-containing protein [Actinomycetota bacterium]